MTTSKKDRYPGPKAFETDESDLFFGRNMEINELYAQVKSSRLVVLYAKSGIGKSSLINAGLIPSFHDEPYQLIKIRLRETDITPIDTIKSELQSYLNADRLARHAGQDQSEVGLWEYLKACEFEEQDKTPVFIFDQFEEFFNHKKENRIALIHELADLINDRLPYRIRQSLRSIPLADRSDEVLRWHNLIDLKVLFAIKSDQLSLMDELKKDISIILNNRFQLSPLNRQQARAAVVQPALIESEEYTIPPFEYEEEALDVILNYLSNEEGEIESFQLQLICQHIEKQLKQK